MPVDDGQRDPSRPSVCQPSTSTVQMYTETQFLGCLQINLEISMPAFRNVPPNQRFSRVLRATLVHSHSIHAVLLVLCILRSPLHPLLASQRRDALELLGGHREPEQERRFHGHHPDLLQR